MGKRVPFADVIAKFELKGLRLLVGEEDYHGVEARHPFLCLKHPDIEQKGTSYSKLKQDGYGCLECARIAHAAAQRKPKKLRTLFSQVVNRFESKGLRLLTEEKNYRGVSVRLAFCCFKHPFNVQPGVSYNKLKDGYGCIDCVTQARTQKRRTPYSEIKAEFEKWNFVLLTPESEFTSTQIPLRYLCLRHPHIKQRPKLYHNLKVQHKGCRACTQERKDTERAKEMFPIVKQTFEEKGLILLETSYVNAKTPMRYICSKHPEVERTKTYDEARNQGCPLCANEAQSERQRTPQENVRTKCLYRGFLLIDEQVYFNAHQHLRFQCLLHPEENYTTTVSTILYGKPGCKKCKSEKISEKQKANFAEGRQIIKIGSANPSWKGGTTEINTYLRQKGEPWNLLQLFWGVLANLRLYGQF